MKRILKIFILIFSLLIFAPQSSLADVIPQYSYNIKYTGIGAFNPPNEFSIYEEPTENSPVIENIKWDKKGLQNDNIKENDLFAVFIPSQDIAYCTVDDETDGWVKIFYSQARGKSGWVKATPKNRYVSWLGFYMSWGHKNGVYIFRDMPDINKRIMSAPSADSQKVAGFIYPKFIKMTLLRGNWMMIKLLDIGNDVQVGWIQWRDENGKFLIFPIMSNRN